MVAAPACLTAIRALRPARFLSQKQLLLLTIIDHDRYIRGRDRCTDHLLLLGCSLFSVHVLLPFSQLLLLLLLLILGLTGSDSNSLHLLLLLLPLLTLSLDSFEIFIDRSGQNRIASVNEVK